MARLAIYVDGGYVAKLAETQFKLWVDYGKLSSKVTEIIRTRTEGSLDLVRTYYYDCLPYQSNSPTPDEARRFSQKRKFLAALERLPKYTVRQGRLMYRGDDSKMADLSAEASRLDDRLGHRTPSGQEPDHACRSAIGR